MNISDAKDMLKEVFHHNIKRWESGVSHRTFVVPALEGDPGVGKTSAVRQAAEELEVAYHSSIVAQIDPGEMGGFGFPMDVEFKDHEGEKYFEKRTVRLRPDFLPDPNQPDGLVGFFNLDELAQAELMQLNICSQLTNEYRIGNHLISPGITMCCTMNRPENKAGTTTLPMHLVDRLTFVKIEPDHKETMTYANRMAWHPTIISFLNKNPGCLHKFTVGVRANPTPRSWEKSSEILQMNLKDHVRREMLTGQIGAGMMVTFEQWLALEHRAADPWELIKNPNDYKLFGPEDIDVVYMLIANLVEIADTKTIQPILTYLKRVPNQEVLAIFITDVLNRHPKLNENKHITNFKIENMAKLVA